MKNVWLDKSEWWWLTEVIGPRASDEWAECDEPSGQQNGNKPVNDAFTIRCKHATNTNRIKCKTMSNVEKMSLFLDEIWFESQWPAHKRRSTIWQRHEMTLQLLSMDAVTLRFWLHGSVVRTSVFDRRTFSALRPIYGWRVTTLQVKCPYGSTNQAHSAFYPSGVGNCVVIHGLRGWRPLNGRQSCVWLFGRRPKSMGAGLAYTAYSVRPLCLWHQSASCSCGICGLWRYISVICLCAFLFSTFLEPASYVTQNSSSELFCPPFSDLHLNIPV